MKFAVLDDRGNILGTVAQFASRRWMWVAFEGFGQWGYRGVVTGRAKATGRVSTHEEASRKVREHWPAYRLRRSA